MIFAQMLKSVLLDSGTTPYKLAKELGVHQTTIKNWLDGHTTPSSEMLSQIANYFALPVAYMLEGYYAPHFMPNPVLFKIREVLNDGYIFGSIEEETVLMKPLYDNVKIAIGNPNVCSNGTIINPIFVGIGQSSDIYGALEILLWASDYTPEEENFLKHHAWRFDGDIENIRPFINECISKFVNIPYPNQTEKPIIVSDDGLPVLLQDPLDLEFSEKFSKLTPDQKEWMVAQIDGILNRRTNK